MAENESTPRPPGPAKSHAPIARSTTVSVAVALSYARAFDRGVELDYADLTDEFDAARVAADRTLEDAERPARAAILRGYEHALVARTKGEAAIPATFTI